MSLNNSDTKNENFSKAKSFPKEILQELLKKHLNNRLTKLETSSNEHITNLNYTSKYFNEFTKAINQFSKFFEDLKASKEKENDKKHNLESNSTVKFEAKKSNESTHNTKNNTKFNQIKSKMDNTLRTRSNTMGLYKVQQMKRQATNINLARGIFSSRILDEQKPIRQKQNSILSPEEDIKNKTMYIKNPGITDTPKTMRKMGSFIEKDSENSKFPKTEKRVKKNVGTNKKVKSNKKSQTNNISKHQYENERYLTETNEEKNGTSKKNDKKNKKSEIKSKKENTLHKKLKTTANLKSNNFNKTINNDFNKTINVEISNKNPDKMNFKTAISTVKRKKIKFNPDLESSNFTDIQDMIKLVDNVSQNINKLLDANDRLNNNRSLMMSSVDINNPNNTFRLSNYRSTANLFNTNNDNVKSKGILKKKKENPNISLFKENDEDNIENPKIKDDFIIGGAQLGKFIIKSKKNISKEKEKEKEKEEVNNKEESETKKLELESSIKETLIEDKKEKNDKNKKEEEKEKIIGIKNFDIIDAFKKNKKLLKNILTYLKEFEIIIFTSCNNYLNKERISFLDNKKEELLQSLNLSKDETMEEKINKIKGEYTEDEISNHPIKFTLSDEAKNKISELNKDENIEIYKNDLDKNNKDINIIIITHRILFVLLCQEEIYSISNDNIFWKKCGEFLLRNNNGNLGNYILQKVDEFIFTSKIVNKIEYIIKDNKENIINELINNNNIMLIPLIKEAMEYCGIIFSKSKTQGNIIITNLKQNQTVINYLNNLKVRYFLAKYEEDDDD